MIADVNANYGHKTMTKLKRLKKTNELTRLMVSHYYEKDLYYIQKVLFYFVHFFYSNRKSSHIRKKAVTIESIVFLSLEIVVLIILSHLKFEI